MTNELNTKIVAQHSCTEGREGDLNSPFAKQKYVNLLKHLNFITGA